MRAYVPDPNEPLGQPRQEESVDGPVKPALNQHCSRNNDTHMSTSSQLRPKVVMVDPENPLTLSVSEKGGSRRNRPVNDVETRSMQQRNDYSALIFVLNLCIMFAAFAQFLTLLTFGNGWQTGCSM